jgi:HKD family nuclease
MKTISVFLITALLVVPAYGGTTKTTTTSTYEESATAPVTGSDVSSDSQMIEAEEYEQPLDTDEVDVTRQEEQEKMEERNQNSSTIIESEDAIDYSDRTRTNRERKALNTGSDASDDQ